MIVTALPAGTVPAMALVSVVVVMVDLLVPWVLSGRTDDESERVRTVTGFESPHGTAVWWSSVLCLLVALFAYSRSRSADATLASDNGWRWRVIAGLFVWTSFDHATHAHEEFARHAHELLRVPEATEPLSLLLAGTAVVVGTPLFREADSRTRQWLGLGSALLLAGAIGVDAVLQLRSQAPGLASRASEATLEWAGLVVLARVLTDPSAWSRPHATMGSIGGKR